LESSNWLSPTGGRVVGSQVVAGPIRDVGVVCLVCEEELVDDEGVVRADWEDRELELLVIDEELVAEVLFDTPAATSSARKVR
jgi:hypothetical protein